jgi:hypothetical protein
MTINHIKLGIGAFVVNHGTFEGKPAIFIEPVEVAGTVGATATDSGLDQHGVAPGGTVITFENPKCAEVVREEIRAAWRER